MTPQGICAVVLSFQDPLPAPHVLQEQPSAAPPSPDPMVAHPIVWRAAFLEDIQKDLVSHTNPHGSINNSDLELAGGFCTMYAWLIVLT